MGDLAAHCTQLLGLGDDWDVTDVKLDLASQRVTIRLAYDAGAACFFLTCGERRASSRDGNCWG